MFKNMKLGAKIGGGFAIVLVLTTIVGFVGYKSMGDVNGIVGITTDTYDIISQMKQARIYGTVYTRDTDDASAKKTLESVGLVQTNAESTTKALDNKDDVARFQDIAKKAGDYKVIFASYQTLTHKQEDAVGNMISTREAVAGAVQAMQSAQEEKMSALQAQMVRKLAERNDKFRRAQVIQTNLYLVRIQALYYLWKGDKAYIDRLDQHFGGIIKECDYLQGVFNDEKNLKQLDAIRTAGQAYRDTLIKAVNAKNPAEQKRYIDEAVSHAGIVVKTSGDLERDQKNKIQVLQKQMDAELAENRQTLALAQSIMLEMTQIRGHVYRYMMQGTDVAEKDTLGALTSVMQHAETIKRHLDGKEGSAQASGVAGKIALYRQAFTDYASLTKQKKEIAAELGRVGVALATTAEETVQSKVDDMQETMANANWFIGACSLVALIAGAILAIFITRGITRPVNRIINNLNEGSGQVAAASEQISAASQSLAEGATEQAASLEETSSALEEMASMARQNADNSDMANTEITDTQQQVQDGARAVSNMSSAMDEISESSDKISNIIKAIEEIAFQTNLLALNAAVEAARAGDAGKGFAVVADEVRNLAQRAAQAARDTAELIEGTVTRVKNGTAIVDELEASFGKIESSTAKVAQLVGEITAASNEQAQGIDQVNTAAAQMDKVTQTNAANAEESASASEELSAQADQLRGIVNELAELVGGTSGQKETSRTAAKRHGNASGGASRIATAAGIPALGHKNGTKATVVKPSELIPLEGESDFAEF